MLGHGETLIEDQPWPKADALALVKEAVTLAVQVNGKLRGTIEMAVSAGKDEIERAALAEPKVADFLAGALPKKIIVVPGKIGGVMCRRTPTSPGRRHAAQAKIHWGLIRPLAPSVTLDSRVRQNEGPKGCRRRSGQR